MSESKQLVLIKYLNELISNNSWKVKAEYSTNDNDKKVVVVQETAGEKVVFFGECEPLFNYYMIDIYGDNIQEEKNMSLLFGDLIGKNVLVEYKNETWQIMFMQFSNFRAIEYMDIRRVGYNSTFKCIINKISEEE